MVEEEFLSGLNTFTHYFSKKYFTEKFASEGLHDHCYENFSIEHIELIEKVFSQQPTLVGLNLN